MTQPTKRREATSAAKRAEALRLLASGEMTPTEVAHHLNVAHGTVRNWASESKVEIAQVAEAKVAGIVEGAAEARRALAEAAPRAASTLLEIMDADEGDPQLLGVRLRAATAALDRGGVPVLTKVEHSGEAVSDATLERLKAALAAARK